MISKWAILIFILLPFCAIDKEVKFKKTGTLTFNVGFIPNHRFRGVISDANGKNHLFYFGDPVTRKIIKIFTESEIIKFNVPLQESIKAVEEIETFQVINPDTIIVFGKQNNKIVLINHLGNIWRNIDLDALVIPYNNGNYRYRPSFSSFSIDGQSCLLKAEYQSKNKNEPPPSIKNYFSESLDLPYFLKIENIFSQDSLIYKFGQFGFYRQFMNDSMAMSELPTYSIENNISLIYSIYSDSIYTIDNHNLILNRKFKVVSNKTSIGSIPINLNSNADYENYLNRIKYDGHIVKAIVDPLNQCFVICIACQNIQKIPLPRKYSYCIYDIKGNKKGEIIMNEENSQGLIYYSDGIYYISNNSFENETDKNSIVKYDMLSLHL